MLLKVTNLEVHDIERMADKPGIFMSEFIKSLNSLFQ